MAEKAKKVESPTRDQRLADAIAECEKQHGRDVVVKGIPPLVGRLPTGSLGLDIHMASPVTGGEVRGGWPFGHIVLLWAGEATGKTLLCCHAIREIQKLGGIACFVDFEKATAPHWVEKIGGDPSKVQLVQAANLNAGFDVARKIIKADPGLVIVDSLVGIESQAEAERSFSDGSYGGSAQKINEFMRCITGSLAPTLSNKDRAVPNNTIVMLTNQERVAVGQTYGESRLLPGGKAQRHQSHVWLQLSRVDWVEEGASVDTEGKKIKGTPVGQDVTVEWRKNYGCPPKKKCMFRIFFADSEEWGATEGMIDVAEECLRWGREAGIVELAGAWWKYGDVSLGQGERAACRFLREHPEVQDELETHIRTAYGLATGQTEPETTATITKAKRSR